MLMCLDTPKLLSMHKNALNVQILVYVVKKNTDKSKVEPVLYVVMYIWLNDGITGDQKATTYTFSFPDKKDAHDLL